MTELLPVTISSSPLPSWLSRHVDVAFNSDDISALIKSIEASQRSEVSKLPHLPAEIILHILEYVPIAYILEFRRVCRGFREYIDTGVQFSYLSRTKLLGYIGPRESLIHFLALHDDTYDKLQFMHARFSHIKHAGWSSDVQQAKWSQPYAIFKIDDVWFDTFSRNKDFGLRRGNELLKIILERLSPQQSRVVGTLRWCVQLDEAVLDLEFQSNMSEKGVEIDFQERTIQIKWTKMFKELLRTEMRLRLMLEEKQSSDFTFGHAEDCLRSIRRQHFRSKLDMNESIDRQVNWALNTLPPLFGKPRHHKASPPWDQMETAEDDAARVLMLLRREAAMTSAELSRLKRLAVDRELMIQDLTCLTQQFRDWTNMMYITPLETRPLGETRLNSPTVVRLPRNPVEWTDETIAIEEQQVRKWKSQEATRGVMADLLQTSMEGLSLPEDVFDDRLSDI